jgi:hypothetical protein
VRITTVHGLKRGRDPQVTLSSVPETTRPLDRAALRARPSPPHNDVLGHFGSVLVLFHHSSEGRGPTGRRHYVPYPIGDPLLAFSDEAIDPGQDR